MATDTKTPPLVIIGIDAGDPHFIQNWAQKGYLPTIVSMMKQGCWGQTGGAGVSMASTVIIIPVSWNPKHMI